jgi:hypothetical protein
MFIFWQIFPLMHAIIYIILREVEGMKFQIFMNTLWGKSLSK